MLADLRADARWLASGFLMTMCSGFGQTYFVALFAGELKVELALTDGQFGGLYTLGTLASAALLVWAGKLADQLPVRWLGAGVIVGLALTSLGMAAVASPAMLALVFFGLRFFGQGMLTHVPMTAVGRWFYAKRGRAASIASLGLPASEGLFPMAAVALMAGVGWRGAWAVAAAALLIVAAPALVALLARDREPSQATAPADDAETVPPPRREWSRAEVLKSPLFYALLPGVLAPPFIITAVFFNQVTIASSKDWGLGWFAANFPVLAVMNILSALAAGALIDRFGARRLLPAFLLPLGAAVLMLTFVETRWILPIVMALIGATLGGTATIQGTLWVELYGARHLGAIRSVAVAGMVLASALSPGLIGVLLDAGVALESQFFVMGVYCFAAALLMAAILSRLHRVAAG